MKRIMSVDDSSSLRLMVSLSLEMAGYEVVQAVDGLDAMNKLQGREFHLFLVDYNMPTMNGIEFTKRIRSLPEYKYVPLLLLTTESSDERKKEGKDAGATGWLTKPFTKEKLVAVVQKVVR